MMIVHRTADGERELDVAVDRRLVTVGDLADAIGETGRSLVVDGTAVGRDLALNETPLVVGSVVWGNPAWAQWVEEQEGDHGDLGCAVFVTVAGLDAGRRVPLTPGTWVVGRRPGNDIELANATVSLRHARLRVAPDGHVDVRDLRSRNGTWLGESALDSDWRPLPPGAIIRFGAVSARVEPAGGTPRDRPTTLDPLRHADPVGRLTFNRPPRPTEPSPPEALRLPRPPLAQGGRPALAVLPALLPAVAGVVTVMVTGNWLFALLPLLSPVVALAGWWQARRSAGRASRRDQVRFLREIEETRAVLAETAAAELVRRRTVLPDLGEVVRRAHQPSSRLWERRVNAPGWLRLTAGTATIPWSPPHDPVPEPVPDALRSMLEEFAQLVDAPAEVDLTAGGVVGLVGSPDVARALARSLLAQAVVHHGPADLRLTVLSSSAAAASWGWSRWLPQIPRADGPNSPDDPAGNGTPIGQPCVGTEAGNALLRTLLAAVSTEEVALGRRTGTSATAAGAPGGSATASRRRDKVHLVVVDNDELLAGPRAPARAVLRGDAGPVAGIVVPSSADRLPASCTTIIELSGPDGRAILRRAGAQSPEHPAELELLAATLSERAARHLARALARFEDGEQGFAAGLVGRVRLLQLLGDKSVDAESMARRWSVDSMCRTLAVPLGVTADGPLMVDLVADGPHALVAGTTGAGKSELLRSWVAGLAATVHPRHLNFVLIDYKGGSAFDQCARLPHTVAVVTDLDESLAERALLCLEAELRYREGRLREAGVSDLEGYRRPGSGRPALARLVVMVDEFATLAAELPGFLDALVGVAQRGRSLGVHLVLATQRPAGVIGDNIRANTALRVALRVQDRHDSVDVLGSEIAAELPRETPGRAVVRFGPGEQVVMQTALVSSAPPSPGIGLDVRPLPAVGPRDGRAKAASKPAATRVPPQAASVEEAPSETDLAALVEAAVEAARRLQLDPPRSPWPPPLPADLILRDLDRPKAFPRAPAATDDLVSLFLVDDPDQQDQYVGGWRPSDGNFLVVGPVGSGTTTALATLSVSLTREAAPDRLHLYVVDAAGGALDSLADLPHCGGVIRIGDQERLVRLVQRLRDELDLRRSLDVDGRQGRPEIVLVIDGWSALQAELELPGQLALGEDLARVISEGPDLGLRTVIGADRPGALRPRLAATVNQRLVLGPPESSGARGGRAAPGFPTQPRDRRPGRGLLEPTGLAVQVALPGRDGGLVAAVATTVRTWADVAPGVGPRPLGRLPLRVGLDAVLAAAHAGGEPWWLPIGLGSSELVPTGWTMHGGDQVLITGPARSGRSSTLRSVAAALRHCRPDLALVAVCSARSPLRCEVLDGHLSPDQIGALGTWIEQGATAVLVDDAEMVEDPAGILAGWIDAHRADVLVVAAARNDAARSQYGSWIRRLRTSRLGLLLEADPDSDGDLLGVRLPRRPPAPPAPGRGYLIDGSRVEYVQVAEVAPSVSSDLPRDPTSY
jgi:S-DNA-T family DNA segregation ATPase FtsK/SpoIIIE